MSDASVSETGTLTDRQWERVAYGAAHAIIQQVLDNGQLDTVDIAEFLPLEVQEVDVDFEKLQQVIEGIVQSDLWEQQAKRDG